MSNYFWTKPRYPSLKTHSDFNHVPRVCTNLPAWVDFEERCVSSYLNLYLILSSQFQVLFVCMPFFLNLYLAFQNNIGETLKKKKKKTEFS